MRVSDKVKAHIRIRRRAFRDNRYLGDWSGTRKFSPADQLERGILKGMDEIYDVVRKFEKTRG